MEKIHSELLDLLNGSGFPFQIGVRREIERTTPDHGWSVCGPGRLLIIERLQPVRVIVEGQGGLVFQESGSMEAATD